MALKVIGQRTFLAPKETQRALMMAAISGIQDTEPRLATRGLTLEFPEEPRLTKCMGAISAFFVLPWRKVLTAQAGLHTAPLKSASKLIAEPVARQLARV